MTLSKEQAANIFVADEPPLLYRTLHGELVAISQGRKVRVHGVESGSPRSVMGIDSGDLA